MALKTKPGVAKPQKRTKGGGTWGVTPVSASSGANAGAGGYYSPRQYGEQTELYSQKAEAARAAMEERSKALRDSQKALEESRAEVERKKKRYYDLSGQLSGDGAAELLAGIEQEWTDSVAAYGQQKAAYDTAWAAYSPYEDAYNKAAAEYNDYLRQEQEAYGAWKATIRTAEDIRQEQKGLKGKRAELQRRMQWANEIAAGTAAPGIQAQAAQNEAAIRELQEYLGTVAAREKLLAEELGWSEHFLHEELRQNADFAEKSQFTGVNNSGDRLYQYINGNRDARGSFLDWVDAGLDQAIPNEGTREALGINWTPEYLEYMTENEIAMYNYLYSTKGTAAANTYLDYLKQDLTARQMGATEELTRMLVGQNWVTKTLGSAASVPMNAVSGLQGLVGTYGTYLRGEELDPNASYYAMGGIKNTIRDEVTKNWGPAGSFAYHTGLGIADMLADAAAGPGAMVLIGSRSFSEEVVDAKKRGLSDEQAMELGAVSALAELLTEKIGVDEMLRLPEKWKTAGFWKGALRGALGEAGEEGITNLVNLAADISIAGDKGEFMKNVQGYRDAGMDDQKAMLAALGDAGISLGLDMLGGAVSGGVFGGWKGKRAAAKTQQNKNDTAESAASEKPAEEPMGVADNGTTPTDNGTTPTDNGTGGTLGAGNTAQVGKGNVQKAGNAPQGKNRDGMSLEELKREAVNRRNPLISGVMQTARDEELVRRIQNADTKTEVTAIDRGLSQEDTEMLLRIREYTGREIIVEEFNDTFHAYYDRANDEIHVAADSKNIMASSFGHELTHTIEETKGWKKLLGLVQERTEDQGQSWEQLRQEKIRFYAEKGQALTADEADAEIVARYVEQHLLTDENAIRQLVRDNRSAARRILDWLDDIWAKVAKTEGAKEREFIRNARECYRAALGEAGESRKRRELHESMADAYADGDDDAGDAAFDALYAEDGSLLEVDWSDFDPDSMVFSFAGEGAKNADMKALTRAKRMERRGDGMRKIFRETGWFRGADRKWRFEIDDSGMKYHKMGDAQFRKDHPEYVRFRELELKFIEGTITDAEIAEMAELRSTWANEAPRLRQMVVHGNAKLRHVLAHDALFEQYPQLLDVRVRFGDTDNAGGYWDQERNEIVISNRYRHADPAFLELTLLHEIQHAIQDIEGFTGGSNPEYWEQRQRGSDPIREHDAAIAKAEREAQAALKDVPPEVQKDFWYAANMRHNDPEGAEKLENELFEGEYADAYSDYSWAIWTLQDLLEQDNPKRTAKDLYRSTAGEIEARDAANRRHLDAETRKNRLPDTGDERTVFVEGDSPVANDFIGWTAEGNEVYQTSAATMAMTSKDRFDAFKKKYLSTFTGRTVKFYRNGHTYYARFAQTDSELGKLAHEGNGKGSQSSASGYKAKIRLLADGSIFELVEDAAYHSSKIETGIGKNKTHRHAKHWDYYVKTVVVDGKAYDVVINVRADSRKGDYSDKEQYVYSIRFRDNKTAATPVASPAKSKVLRVDGVAVDNNVPDSGQNVKQYSMKDSAGRELSEEQQEFFRGSKVRDEQGRLMVMYHGTPNGNHTKFRSGTYFTPMREYADKYQNPNASMLSTKRNAVAPKTYEVYLNITKPFDTRNPQERKIFEEEYYRKWGTGAPLADSGLPDWTDGVDLQEFIEEMEYDYDGLILDEGATGGYGMEVKSRGLSYVTFNPEQVKNVDNTAPTNSPDIRFSFKGEENGFTEGWHDDDEAARAAQMEGYPVLNGVQVVPMKTWVRARDYKRNPDGSIFYDKQGNPVQYDNYGLVAGLGDKPGTLKVNFHNKNVVNEETGQTIRRDNVQIAYEDLTPTPGVFHQTDEDFDSLIGQAPEEPGSYDYSEEELAEIEELRSRASMEEDAAEERPTWTAVEPEKLSGKERGFYNRALRKLAEQVARALDVPRQAKREFLEPIAQRIANEYLQTGTISQKLRNELFEEGWKQGIVVDREFYDTYKEVKDYLRTTGITLSETDRDSRDWNEFRKRSFGTLKLVNEGGLPVDTAWGELQEMAPALFPNDILNPEDQLRHMYEVGRSIQKVERSLDEFYGTDAALMKQASRNDFEVAVQTAMAELRQVKRVADERAGETAAVTGEEGEELTAEAVMALYPKLKETRRAAEKAMAKNLLTKQDKKQVQRLLRGDIQPEHLDPRKGNVQGILEVYQTKKAYEEAAAPIRKWNRQQKAKLYAEAEGLMAGAGRIVDKKRGYLYSRETLERNFRDIFKNREAAERMVQVYAKPVHEGSANAIRMKNRYRERVKALNLSRKVAKGNTVSEAYAVQFYGEVSDILRMMEESKFRLKKRDGKTYLEWKAELQKLWEENPNLDKGKIEDAVREFGKIYEELFSQMNEVRVRNGYEPINHRRGYFPHFQQDGRDGIMGLFGKALGIDVEVQQLPTTINGLTHTFKPGIRWFGNALERKGFDTAYDAVEGFDRYIEGVADVVHHTDNIQRLRALANQIRCRTSDEGLREQIQKIQERTDLSDEEKDTLIREKTSEGKFELSNFVVELDEYTNLLANKKSRADRNMEQAMGRDMYNLVKGLEGRVAANMVAINPGSWLTNFIPITQGWACLDTRMMLRGMRDTVLAVKNDDGIVDESDFLTGRQGSDPLVRTAAQEWSGKLSKPMEWIDGFTAGTLVRARLQQNLAHGMSRAEAMSEANEWTAGVMADRTKGAMPTVFHRSNPLTKLFTQFQLEVNNQLSYLFKDIPREKRDKAKKELALALLKFAIGAWLYNEAYEFFFGRRPALDVADMAFGFVRDWADPELDFADALMGAGEKVAENTPFIGGLLGGGRVPISSALPDAENLIKAIGNKEWGAKKRLATAAKELAKPAVYMLPPFGGGQIKKVWEGLKMIAQGGSYTVDAEGNPMLQYPLYSTDNAVQKALEAGQAMVFGKTTIRSGREWVDGGFGNLSAEQTATYQALIAMDVEQADAFELLTELREAEKTDAETRTQVQRDILRNSGLEGEALATVYYDLMTDEDSKERIMMDELLEGGADMGQATFALMDIKDAEAMLTGTEASNTKREILRASGLEGDALATMYYHLMAGSEKEQPMLDRLRKNGADMGKAANAMMDIKDADANLTGAKRSNAIRDAIRCSGLTEGQKREIYRYAVSEEHEEKIEKFKAEGLDIDDYLIARNQYSTIDEQYEDEGDKATAFARWVNKQGYTAAQKAVVRAELKYWQMMPADSERYDAGIEAGLSDEDAYGLREDLKNLTPLEGEDDVKQYQKWREAIDSSWDEASQLKWLKAVGMNDAAYDKCEALWGVGVAPAAYVRAKELESQFNEDGKGTLKNEEWTKLINSLVPSGVALPGDKEHFNLTNEQMGFLWQMLTGSKSTKNNPFSAKGGEKWLKVKG